MKWVRWSLTLAAIGVGSLTVWIAPRGPVEVQLGAGASIAAFALAIFWAPSRRISAALALSAVVIGFVIAGAFDAVPTQVIATVATIALPLGAAVLDRRARRAEPHVS